MYLKTYEKEGLTQLDHVRTYRRAVLKSTLNWWVSSEAEILLKSKATIDFQKITLLLKLHKLVPESYIDCAPLTGSSLTVAKVRQQIATFYQLLLTTC